jgi:DNA polymerase-3 subunit beta
MKFSCRKDLIQNAVNAAARTAAARSTIPALEGLLIDAGNIVSISGFDLKTGITAVIPADIEETGKIVINARFLSELIRRLSDETVTFECGNSLSVRITCGMSEFEIMGISAEDYPDLPVMDYQNSIYISEKTLGTMISQTNFAVSTNEARPIHTGTLFDVEDGMLTMVAVDGYRLALRKEELLKSDLDKVSFVVPGAALSEVEKLVSDSEEQVKITLGAKHIMFTMGTIELISRRLEGEFLNYKNTVNMMGKIALTADKNELIDTIERVSLIISDKIKSPIRCVFEKDLVKLNAVAVIGRASDECRISGDGENLEIGFNNKYLLDALKAAPADTLSIRLTNGISPCIIVPADEKDNFLYMVLPVRLKANEG